MSILNEIKDLHDSLKAIALNTFLLPFWYASIYLFNHEFYKSADTIIILVMCVIISLVSSGLFALISFMAFESLKKVNKDPQPDDDKNLFSIMLTCVVLLCAWLSILMFIIYSLGFLFKIYIYFYYFLVIYFSPLIFILFLKILNDKKII